MTHIFTYLIQFQTYEVISDTGKFTPSLINNPDTIVPLSTIKEFNSNYGCEFCSGALQLAVIHFLPNSNQVKKEIVDIIADKVASSLKPIYNNYHDLITYYNDSMYCILFNYKPNQITDSERDIRNIRTKLKEYYLLMEEVNFYYYITQPITNISGVQGLCREVKLLMSQRFLNPPNSVITSLPNEEEIVEDYLTKDFYDNFVKYIDTFQIDMLKDQEKKLILMLKSKKIKQGHIIEQIYYGLIEAEIHEYRTNITSDFEEIVQEQKLLYLKSDDYPTLFSDFYNSVINFMDTILTLQHKDSVKPIYLAKEYIHIHFKEHLTLDVIGKEVGLNPVYLSSLFKRETKKSIVDYIAEIRIENAKKLLMDTEIMVNQIAEMTGFSDIKYFSKTFKKVTGLAPSEYRKLYY